MAVDTVKLTANQRMGFAIETTTGTAATLDAAAAACLVMDPVLNPDQQGIKVPNPAGFGNKRFLKGAAKCTASFSDYMTGIGTGDGVHDGFLLACGAVNAEGVYSFTNATAGTATIGVYKDGLLDTGIGMVGNCVFTIKPGEPVLRKFDFQGAYAGRSDTSIPTPVTDPTLIAPQVVSATITIGGAAYTWDEMTIDLGNQIILRASEAGASGIKAGKITNAFPTVTIQPEALALATKNWGSGFGVGTPAALSIAISGGTGNSFTIAASLELTKYPGLVDASGRVAVDLAFEVVNQSLTITHT